MVEIFFTQFLKMFNNILGVLELQKANVGVHVDVPDEYTHKRKNNNREEEEDKLYNSIINYTDSFVGPWIKGNAYSLSITFESTDVVERLAPYFFTSFTGCRSLLLKFSNKYEDEDGDIGYYNECGEDLVMSSFGVTVNGGLLPSSLLRLPFICEESLRNMKISSICRYTNCLKADDLVDWLHQYSIKDGERKDGKEESGGRRLELSFYSSTINPQNLRDTLIEVFVS